MEFICNRTCWNLLKTWLTYLPSKGVVLCDFPKYGEHLVVCHKSFFLLWNSYATDLVEICLNWVDILTWHRSCCSLQFLQMWGALICYKPFFLLWNSYEKKIVETLLSCLEFIFDWTCWNLLVTWLKLVSILT